MHHEARLVWEEGFPPGITLVIDEHLLSVKRLEVTANDRYGTIRVVLVRDGEYLSLREVNEQEALVLFFGEQLDKGTIEWQEGVLSCRFCIPSDLDDREERGAILLERYEIFLSMADVGLTPDLVPEVEWLSDAP